MLRQMRTKIGREFVVRFLRVLKKLKLGNDAALDLAVIMVVFSELKVKKK